MMQRGASERKRHNSGERRPGETPAPRDHEKLLIFSRMLLTFAPRSLTQARLRLRQIGLRCYGVCNHSVYVTLPA